MATMAALPHVDEHRIVIEAPAAAVWPALCRVVLEGSSGAARETFAKALGCDPATPDLRPTPREGDAIVGFRIVRLRPEEELVLEGTHRFSSYRLGFHLDRLGTERVHLRARTDAAFPGATGRVYRALVIGTRGHALLMRRMLGSVKARAEGP